MDKRTHLAWKPQLVAALAQALPSSQHAHADAQLLFLPETAEPGPHDAAMAPLIEGLGLLRVEQVALALCLWTEVDARWSALLALLQGPGERLGPARPTLGLVDALACQLAPDEAPAWGEMLQGTAIASGLLQTGDAQAPAHARVLQLHPGLLGLLTGRRPVQPLLMGRLALRPAPRAAWPLPAAWCEAARRLSAQACEQPEPSVIVLRGPDRDELHAVAAQVALHLGRHALELHPLDDAAPGSAHAWQALASHDAIVPALLAAQGLALWPAPSTPGRAIDVPEFPHLPGPLVVLAAVDAALSSRLELHEFELGLPDAADRLAVWVQAQPQDAAPLTADARAAVMRSHCGISVLARAARQAARGTPAREAIEQAVRASARGLSAWAQVSNARVPADAWVGAGHLHRELGLLLTRCIAREDAAAPLGPLLAGRLNAGVKALFIGASGTGKTLAAQWLADRLARPLVRVDLASVVSKYIGETEKNLAELLARAEHLDAVLLFDEADSLFGARTDVKQANDRYANMQTNYLLQRLETFHGVAVLTSNSKGRFDDAFMRRLDAVIEFPLPDVAERRALWALHLGDVPGLDPVLLNQVAALADLAGGHIRNAALTAALLARQRLPDAGSADLEHLPAIEAADLREALALEYRKLGHRVPDSLSR